jgi:hypothetical protein
MAGYDAGATAGDASSRVPRFFIAGQIYPVRDMGHKADIRLSPGNVRFRVGKADMTAISRWLSEDFNRGVI